MLLLCDLPSQPSIGEVLATLAMEQWDLHVPKTVALGGLSIHWYNLSCTFSLSIRSGYWPRAALGIIHKCKVSHGPISVSHERQSWRVLPVLTLIFLLLNTLPSFVYSKVMTTRPGIAKYHEGRRAHKQGRYEAAITCFDTVSSRLQAEVICIG